MTKLKNVAIAITHHASSVCCRRLILIDIFN